MERYNTKNLIAKLGRNAASAVEGRLIDQPYDPLNTGLVEPVSTLSMPRTRWAEKVDLIEAPFAPIYDLKEYYDNPALTAMGYIGMMEMLKAFGVPRSLQTSYDIKPLNDMTYIVAGCGTGREVIALAALGAGVIGFDATIEYANITAQKVGYAQQELGKLDVTLYQALAEEFDYRQGGAVNGISSLFGVINHVEEWRNTVKLMSEGLQPDGILVIEKYGPESALVFNEVQNGLAYKPSILQKRTSGGILLGEDTDDVLPAVFPDDDSFSNALSDAGLEVKRRYGFLRFAALFPQTPTEANLALFKDRIRELDEKAYSFLTPFTLPSDILYATMLYDRLPRNQRQVDQFAYALYVCRKI